jgi:hypothetical protein
MFYASHTLRVIYASRVILASAGFSADPGIKSRHVSQDARPYKTGKCNDFRDVKP